MPQVCTNANSVFTRVQLTFTPLRSAEVFNFDSNRVLVVSMRSILQRKFKQKKRTTDGHRKIGKLFEEKNLSRFFHLLFKEELAVIVLCLYSSIEQNHQISSFFFHDCSVWPILHSNSL